MQPTRLKYLLQEYATSALSEEETAEMAAYIELPGNEQTVADMLHELLNEAPHDEQIRLQEWRPFIQQIVSVDRINDSSAITAHRVHFLQTAWLRYAAVLLLVAGAAVLLFQVNRPSLRQLAEHPVKQPADVLPGGNKAVLTLSDGSTILLDSAADGPLAQQGGSRIIKTASGSLAYERMSTAAETGYNTIRTPKGGQYQIALPDGSKAWLNAASSISFPTTFRKDYKVSITGEVYFETAADKNKPFSVTVNSTEITVLGTSFNINGYTDEPSVRTTLLQGSVRVISLEGNKHGDSVLLKPGEQASTGPGRSISIGNHTDLEEVMAWKNGVFQFNHTPVTGVMRQIARWYDLEIVYSGVPPEKAFTGQMDRNLTLSQVLTGLKALGLKTTLKDRELIVSVP